MASNSEKILLKPLDRPVKVGFLGAGNVLWAYLQLMDRLIPQGIAIEGPIAARNQSVWEGIQARRPGAELVCDVESVLTSDSDVIVIITSPDSHCDLTRRALEMGKHVVVEKPIAGTIKEAQGLADLANSKGLYLLAAPFIELSPTFQLLWSFVSDGRIGTVHSARALYGNSGSNWAEWYHNSSIGPLAEIGIYNLKSLALLLGPIVEVTSREASAYSERVIAGKRIKNLDPDVNHVILRHADGALSSIVSSHAIKAYRRPAIELYGTEGTANLLGDDWDPEGVDIWTDEKSCWQSYAAMDRTWLWTDGLANLVNCLKSGELVINDLQVDIHLIEVLEAARGSSKSGHTEAVDSSFDRVKAYPRAEYRHRVHDRTRPADLQ